LYFIPQVRIDFYPYHLAKGSRRSWPKYTDNTLSQWLHQALQTFKISLMETLSASSMHTPLTRTQPQGSSQYQSGTEHNVVKDAVTSQLGKLMSTCLVLIIQDFRLFRVTTSSKRTAPLPFISSKSCKESIQPQSCEWILGLMMCFSDLNSFYWKTEGFTCDSFRVHMVLLSWWNVFSLWVLHSAFEQRFRIWWLRFTV